MHRERERNGGDKWEGRDCENEIEDRNTEEEKTKFTNPVLFCLFLSWLRCYTVMCCTSRKYCCNNDFKICVIWPFSRSGVSREKLVGFTNSL